MSDSLLTAPQLAKLLGVPTTWVYEQSRRGHIPTVTLGRYRRYRAEAINEWLEELERNGGSAALGPRSRGRRISPRGAASASSG